MVLKLYPATKWQCVLAVVAGFLLSLISAIYSTYVCTSRVLALLIIPLWFAPEHIFEKNNLPWFEGQELCIWLSLNLSPICSFEPPWHQPFIHDYFVLCLPRRWMSEEIGEKLPTSWRSSRLETFRSMESEMRRRRMLIEEWMGRSGAILVENCRSSLIGKTERECSLSLSLSSIR